MDFSAVSTSTETAQFTFEILRSSFLLFFFFFFFFFFFLIFCSTFEFFVL